MRYTLWSRDRLLGHTDLDIPCVQSHIRQGFIEPTVDGQRILPDATGVFVATAANRRARREGTDENTAMADFNAACDRREALDLELRDENGERFECDFMRVYDLRDRSWEEELAHEFPEEDLEIENDPELKAAIEHDVELLLEDDLYGSSWEPVDERWETMQYHVMVHLKKDDTDF